MAQTAGGVPGIVPAIGFGNRTPVRQRRQSHRNFQNLAEEGISSKICVCALILRNGRLRNLRHDGPATYNPASK